MRRAVLLFVAVSCALVAVPARAGAAGTGGTPASTTVRLIRLLRSAIVQASVGR